MQQSEPREWVLVLNISWISLESENYTPTKSIYYSHTYTYLSSMFPWAPPPSSSCSSSSSYGSYTLQRGDNTTVKSRRTRSMSCGHSLPIIQASGIRGQLGRVWAHYGTTAGGTAVRGNSIHLPYVSNCTRDCMGVNGEVLQLYAKAYYKSHDNLYPGTTSHTHCIKSS